MTDTRYPHLSDTLLDTIDWFTDQMKRQLEENHHKGDRWQDDDADQFAYATADEVEELKEAVSLADRHSGNLRYQNDAIKEAADTANMAMFTAARLHDRIP